MQTTDRTRGGAGREIARARGRLLRVRAELGAEAAAFDDARLRMLVSETPVAGVALHERAARLGRLRTAVHEAERRLLLLWEEGETGRSPGP